MIHKLGLEPMPTVAPLPCKFIPATRVIPRAYPTGSRPSRSGLAYLALCWLMIVG